MTKLTIYSDDEFSIHVETLWFGWILHGDVHVRWSQGVRKRLTQTMRAIVKLSGKRCYAFQTPSHDPKKKKFIQSIGGTFDHYRFTPDGEKAEMYRFHTLD